MKPTNFKELIQAYLSSPSVYNLAPRTVSRYTKLSHALLEILNPNLTYTADPASGKAISDAFYAKMKVPGASNAKINDQKAHLNRLYTWGTENYGVAYDSNPAIYMGNLRHEPKETNPFTKGNMLEIKDYMNSKYCKLRESEVIMANIMLFLFSTGMRPREMMDLKTSDIVMDDNGKDKLIAIRGSKAREANKVSRYLFVTEDVEQYINVALEHRASRTDVSSDSLWVSVRGKQLTQRPLDELFKRTLSKVGLPKKELYDLRRGCATNIIHDDRYGVTVAQKQLGHKDLRTTMVYERLGKREAARLFKGH